MPEDLPWNELIAACRASFNAEMRTRGGGADRDELFDEVLLRVVHAYRTRYVEDPERASLRTWVSRQVGWALADLWRARYRRVRRAPELSLPDDEPPDGAEDVGANLDRAEVQNAVQDCLSRLTAAQRERLLAAEECRDLGQSQGELARRLGIALDTLKEALSRARALLRDCLRRKGFDPNPPRGAGATE